MRKNIIVLAKASLGNKEDMEFYNMMLRNDQENGINKSCVMIIFPSVRHFKWYLEDCKPGYRYILFVHMGNKSMNPPQDGQDLTDDLLDEIPSDGTKFTYITRVGESKFNGRNVISAAKLVRGNYDLSDFEENVIPENNVESKAKLEFAILTALMNDEHAAFDSNMNATRSPEKNIKIGSFLPAKSDITDYRGEIVTMWQQDMGPIDAAAFATRLISCYQPRFLIMGGVCGGLQEEVKLYDVIIPLDIHDYISGKYVDGKLLPRPLKAKPSDEVVGFLKEHELEILRRMEDLAPLNMREIVKKVAIHYKVYASGPWVMKTEGVLQEMAEIKDIDIVGLEMESIGVIRAATLFAKHTEYGLVAKSVMDFTDGNKTDTLNGVPVKTNAAMVSYLYIRSAMPLLEKFVDPKG